ncbi:hypothetical protein [Paraclostridium bifermentans]|uniref:hypothetical protein n=1 Tax=Paraclostridium bifermentans TaxID=1490 RepID=UPI00359C1155
MKFKKIDKNLIYVFITIGIIILNIFLVYKPIKNKETRLLNQIKVIKKLEKEKVQDDKKYLKSENLIMEVDNYFKDSGMIEYIKSNQEEGRYSIDVEVNGNKDLIVGKIMEMEKLDEDMRIENLCMKNIDGQNINCKLKINTK